LEYLKNQIQATTQTHKYSYDEMHVSTKTSPHNCSKSKSPDSGVYANFSHWCRISFFLYTNPHSAWTNIDIEIYFNNAEFIVHAFAKLSINEDYRCTNTLTMHGSKKMKRLPFQMHQNSFCNRKLYKVIKNMFNLDKIVVILSSEFCA
jgi:hypothetical protein